MASRAKVISNTVAYRIRCLREKVDLTQIELANRVFKSESTVRMWELGKSEPDLATINLLAEIFGTSTDYIIAGTSVGAPIQIPVLGYVAAGIPIEAITDILDYEEIAPEMLNDGSEYFALRIKGDSMEPKISDGDVVIVRKQSTCDSGQVCIVCVNGDEATCKKVIRQDNGIMLVQNNPAYQVTFYSNKEIEDKPITILGRVVELRAKF